jgi:hypothetical protein
MSIEISPDLISYLPDSSCVGILYKQCHNELHFKNDLYDSTQLCNL